jgi:D-glycero-alpha-D-manno-heptose 1-phosphate guanylyltransferase
MSAKAIILAGGLGTRLRDTVRDVPKPMAPVAGKPFLEYLINSLALQGYKDVILSVGYKWETIRGYFGDGDAFDVRLRYCVEDTPLGTGGALREALESGEASRFIVFNGDTFNRLDYRDMEAHHTSKKALFTVGLVYKRNAGRYGLVHVDEEGRILRFSEKTSSGCGYINSGVYIMDKAILDLMPCGHFSLEADLFPKLVGNAFYGYPDRHFFVDIGVVSTYRYVNRHPSLFQEKGDHRGQYARCCHE